MCFFFLWLQGFIIVALQTCMEWDKKKTKIKTKKIINIKKKQLFKIIFYLSFETVMFVLPISVSQVHWWFSMKESKSFKSSTHLHIYLKRIAMEKNVHVPNNGCLISTNLWHVHSISPPYLQGENLQSQILKSACGGS